MEKVGSCIKRLRIKENQIRQSVRFQFAPVMQLEDLCRQTGHAPDRFSGGKAQCVQHSEKSGHGAESPGMTAADTVIFRAGTFIRTGTTEILL